MSRSLDAASSQPTDKQQSSNSSTKTLVTDHDLLTRVNDAEEAQTALVSELMMVRAEATVARQKMVRTCGLVLGWLRGADVVSWMIHLHKRQG